MIIEIIIIGSIILAIFLFKSLTGEKERIETLFRVYRNAKNKLPEAAEKQLLEIVIEWHIPPGRSKKLKDLGITGKKYIDDVFESNLPSLEELIYHIIVLEFPEKYNSMIDLDKIEKEMQGGQLAPKSKLKLLIKKYHQKYL